MGDAIDELTGMLAAESLRARARELAHQSRRCREPVGVIVGEVDPGGTERGEALLRELAGVLLDSLRAYDLAYRVGERRFVVLLPGADRERAADTAERLRACVQRAALDGGGTCATMSFGAAASREGWRFDYESVRREAEAALEQAQRVRGQNLS